MLTCMKGGKNEPSVVQEHDAEVEKERGEEAQCGSGPGHVGMSPPATNQSLPLLSLPFHGS